MSNRGFLCRRASSVSWGSSSTLLPAPSSSLFKPPIGELLPLLTFSDDSPPSAMASSSDDSPPSSRSSSPSADQNSENKSPLEDGADDSFWSSLARRARSVLEDGVPSQPSWEMEPDDSKRLQRKNQNIRLSSQGKWKRQDSLALHKGLEAIASSLSLLSDTLGTALEEGLNLVETKATNFMYLEPRSTCLKKSLDLLAREKLQNSPPKFLTPEKVVETSLAKVHVSSDEKSGLTRDTQLKASRDVAMAMATKAKLLLRELKNVKADLTFTTDRCAQLEEENKRLRESVEKGVRHEEDDLVRLQLETLLAEKARLTQENAAYARENQFLHEVVQYHQLTLRNVVLPDEALMDEAAGLDVDASLDMDFPPMYPQEIDFSVLE